MITVDYAITAEGRISSGINYEFVALFMSLWQFTEYININTWMVAYSVSVINTDQVQVLIIILIDR